MLRTDKKQLGRRSRWKTSLIKTRMYSCRTLSMAGALQT